LGPVPSVDAALALPHQTKPDAALLDVNLQGSMVTPLARECRRRDIPFALVTAYALFDLDEPALEEAMRVRKPCNDDDLRKVLVDLTRRSGPNKPAAHDMENNI